MTSTIGTFRSTSGISTTHEVSGYGKKFDIAVKSMRKVASDRKHHRMVVYETNGKILKLVTTPPWKCVSWESFKESMKSCGPRGTICIGLYNFNFPIYKGSASMKGKVMLALAQDPDRMGAALGSAIQVMKVQMTTVNDIWKPLIAELKNKYVMANSREEWGSDEQVDATNEKWLWKRFMGKTVAKNHNEEESFLIDFPSTNEKVSQVMIKGECKIPSEAAKVITTMQPKSPLTSTIG